MNNLTDSESKLKSSIEYLSLAIKNYETQLKTKSNDPKYIKLILIELYEKILSLNLEYALSQDIDNKLWNLFYSEVEYWRSSINKQNRRNSNRYIENNLWKFQNYLEKITSYYKLLNLKLVLNKKYNKNLGIELLKLKEPKKINRNSNDIYFYTIHKNLICLGDILRYKTMYSSSEDKKWEDALSTYRKAYTIFPDNGKPHAQVAMIETYRYNYLSMIYWYLLSYIKFYPNLIAKDNLDTFYKYMLEKSPPALFINPNIREFLFFLKIIHKEFTVARDFKHLYQHQSDYLRDIFHDPNIPKSVRIQMTKEIYIILISYIYLMNDTFKVTESASTRQNIRNHQAICIILIMENLAANVIALNKMIRNDDSLTNFLFNNEEQDPESKRRRANPNPNQNSNQNQSRNSSQSLNQGQNQDPSEEDNNIVFQLLTPISLCCLWIVNNPDILVIYKNYSKFYEENEEKCYKTFKKEIVNLVNSLTSLTEIDNAQEYLPDDCELLGFLPLRNYYTSIELKSVNQILNSDKGLDNRNQFYIRIGRILTFIKFLIQRYPDKYKYDENEEKYIIIDEDYKKREKSKLSKLMAQERLKKQVEDLKEYVVKQYQPYVIIDENIILNDLPLLRKWVSSKTCRIIIPSNVINIIDFQKNGNAKINTRAREAIRFLEQYYIKPNKFLKVQKNDEKSDIPYEDYYLFKDQELMEKDKEMDGIEVDEEGQETELEDRPKYQNIFARDSQQDRPVRPYYYNRNRENELNEEMTESENYYHARKPSRKYRSFLECTHYFVEVAKKEMAQLASIDHTMDPTSEHNYSLILVTNSPILLRYQEMYHIDCKVMILQEFIKYMAVKRQERKKEN